MKTEMLAMILAGGRGTRLQDLTSKVAKPAVYYGGKYRIIDFPLSNSANSGIDVIGVLTQYESILLNEYVSHSSRWGLEGRDKGIFVLPPRETIEGFGVYRGTADAIYQNIDFLDMYNPDYVLILSGDHIYKMDYSEMLDFHKRNNADLTIAGLEVTMEEAKRFGIMNTAEDDRIVEFEEKPEHPKNNVASMGIYIFSYPTLRKILTKDAVQETDHDFGKNIIPTYLETGKRIFAYRFKGYWKDVGTIDSLWQANMDIIDDDNLINMGDPNWKIYTDDVPTIPQYIGEDAEVEKAYINQGCVVNGKVKNSVLFRDVEVKSGAKVIDSVIMPEAVIGKGAEVVNCIVAEGMRIPDKAKVGNSKTIELISRKEQVE